MVRCWFEITSNIQGSCSVHFPSTVCFIFYVSSNPGKTAHAAVGRIALTMCLAAASGGITQCIVSGLVQMYNRHEHYNTNEIANAVLASLVAVTGCCPFIEPYSSLLIGRKTFYYTVIFTLRYMCSACALIMYL